MNGHQSMWHMSKNKDQITQTRPFHPQTPVHYSLMEGLSVDINFMLIALDDFKYLLVVTIEITNFVLILSIKSRAVEFMAETLIHRIIWLLAHQNSR